MGSARNCRCTSAPLWTSKGCLSHYGLHLCRRISTPVTEAPLLSSLTLKSACLFLLLTLTHLSGCKCHCIGIFFLLHKYFITDVLTTITKWAPPVTGLEVNWHWFHLIQGNLLASFHRSLLEPTHYQNLSIQAVRG